MVEVEFQRVGPGGGFCADGSAGASCIRGAGRGSHALVAAGVPSLWCSLRGRLEVDTSDGLFRVPRRHFLALPPGDEVRAMVPEGGDWVAFALPPAAVVAILRSVGVRRGPGPLLFPTVLPLDRGLLRAAASAIRQAASRSPATDMALGSLLLAAREAQAPTNAWVVRASGRTEGHRRHTVQRLLRARNRILNSPFDANELEQLAAAARYSKSHFLRSFRDVFGHTPHELVVEARMELAKTLIANSDLAISEVAASVGYESRFAFARTFKRHVGLTASDFRERLSRAA